MGKPGDHGGEYGGEAWMGADNSPAAVVPEQPSDECKKLVDANADAKAAMATHDDMPLVNAACKDGGKLGDDKDTPAKYAKVIAAIDAICDAMAECPEYCYPGTETHTDDGVVDSLGNCIDKGTYAGFKQMINDMPVYKKSGTNGRFTAGDPGPALCKAITDATCAAAAVGGAKPKTCPEELFLLQADPSTIKHAADAKAKADAEAKEAGEEEAKFAKEESDLTAKAAKLKEASEKLRDAATAANQKAASDAAANAADTMKKAQAAAADTAKREAAGKEFQAEMKKLEAEMAKQTGDAAKATKARIEKVQA